MQLAPSISSIYPSRQEQLYLPSVFEHSCVQSSTPRSHSSTSLQTVCEPVSLMKPSLQVQKKLPSVFVQLAPTHVVSFKHSSISVMIHISQVVQIGFCTHTLWCDLLTKAINAFKSIYYLPLIPNSAVSYVTNVRFIGCCLFRCRNVFTLPNKAGIIYASIIICAAIFTCKYLSLDIESRSVTIPACTFW